MLSFTTQGASDDKSQIKDASSKSSSGSEQICCNPLTLRAAEVVLQVSWSADLPLADIPSYYTKGFGEVVERRTPPANRETNEKLSHVVRHMDRFVVVLCQGYLGFMLPKAAEVRVSKTEADRIRDT